jgi:hypothetical protein
MMSSLGAWPRPDRTKETSMTSNPMVRGVTRDVMKAAEITDENLALRVEDEMGRAGVNFSECTQRQFDREARAALAVIRELDAMKAVRS